MKFSQYDEEPFLLEYFKDISSGFFIDIGANNGWKGSNTRALFLRGWSGLCVEADPFTFRHLAETYKGEKHIQCVHSAIWDRIGSIEFYSQKTTDSGLSSVNPDYKTGPDTRIVHVLCETLDLLLTRTNNHKKNIDFLTVDAEGCDFNIIQSYSFQRKPGLVMVEYASMDEIRAGAWKTPLEAFDTLMAEHGYKRIWTSVGNAAYSTET